MKTPARMALLALLAAVPLVVLSSRPAEAFWGRRRVNVAYALPSVPVAVGYAPVTVARPVIIASPVVTAGYAPVTTYYAPAPVTTTLHAPASVTTTLYAPAPLTTTYYAPAPITTYYAPAAAAGVIVQRPVLVVP